MVWEASVHMRDRPLAVFGVVLIVFGVAVITDTRVVQMVTGPVLLILVAGLGYRALIRSLLS
jgi:hypothetical protein